MSLMDEYGLDEIDKEIIILLQDHPTITHSEIAKRIGRSQPAVGTRIRKMESKGIISAKYGINFKNVDIHLVKVEILTSKPDEVFEMGDYCPFIINIMRLSGKCNVLILIASTSLKKIDTIIDSHFRNRDYIQTVQMDIITDYKKDFVLPIDFKIDIGNTDPSEACKACRVCRGESIN